MHENQWTDSCRSNRRIRFLHFFPALSGLYSEPTRHPQKLPLSAWVRLLRMFPKRVRRETDKPRSFKKLNRSSSEKAYIKSRSSRLSGKSTSHDLKCWISLRLYPYFLEPHFRAGSCSYAPAKRHTPPVPQFFVAINPLDLPPSCRVCSTHTPFLPKSLSFTCFSYYSFAPEFMPLCVRPCNPRSGFHSRHEVRSSPQISLDQTLSDTYANAAISQALLLGPYPSGPDRPELLDPHKPFSCL